MLQPRGVPNEVKITQKSAPDTSFQETVFLMFYTKPKVIITISVRGQMRVMLARHISQVLEGLPGYIMVGWGGGKKSKLDNIGLVLQRFTYSG